MTTNKELIFLKEKYQGVEQEGWIYVVSEKKLEDIFYSDTYDQYGQQVSDSDAGDCITVISERTLDFIRKMAMEFEEDWGFVSGDVVSAYDETTLYSLVRGSDDLIEGEDYIDVKTSCKGFNYWDGSNWMSIIVESETYEGVTHEEQTGSDIPDIDFEEMVFVKDGFGSKLYEYGEYYIVSSWVQGSWEYYKIILMLDAPENFEENF